MNSLIAQRRQRYLPASKRILAVLPAAAICLAACSVWSQTTATVSVNASSTMSTVSPVAYGVDTSVYDGDLTASGVAGAVQAAGINLLRYPGGSYGDIFNFISGDDQTLNDGGYLAPDTTFGNYWMPDLVIPAGVQAMITTNYGSNLTDNGGGQPSEAASWVQYANVTNNYNIQYWEIGNEIYGNGYYSTGLDWEYDLHYSEASASARVGQSALSPTAYGTNAAAYIIAMKQVDPNIKCGVFLNTASYYTNWDQDVLTAVSNGLKGTGYTLDFVIEHWYPSGTDAQYLAAQTGEYGVAHTVAQFRSDIANYYTLDNGSSIQIAVTESGAGVVGGVFPFLWSVDDYLTWIENGAVNVEYQELHAGFLSNVDTPDGPWYGASLSSTIARPGDTMVSTSSSNSLLRTHAVKRTDGQTGIVLLNDDPSNNTSVTVNVSGATLAGTGTQYNFGNANFSSGATTANSGISKSSISGVGSSFTVTVPAYSAMGILIPTSSSCTATAIVPEMNVGGVWTEESSATVSSTTAVVDLGPQPLTGGSWSWTGPNGFTSTAREIDSIPLTAGTDVYTATYTNSCGTKSTQAFTITVSGGSSTLIANGTYIITAVNSGLAIDDPDFSKTDGEDLDIYTVNDGTNQQWTVTNLGNNVITLTNSSSGQLVDVAGASKSSGALVDQWPGNGQTNQEWNVISVAGGAFELTSVNSGLALSVIGGGTGIETGLEQLTYSGSTSQQWKFTSY
jgi:hypothetical protein